MTLDEYFPLAARYRSWFGRFSGVREASARFKAFSHTERHLQCVWFDPALRPTGLRTSEGEPVVVEDPGVWNLEAGPDFLGAALCVGAGRRRVRGDVEIHIHPGDWVAHGHDADARYAQVCAHVTFFGGTLPAETLPPGALQISLREPLAAQRGFAFDVVDVSAYPYSARAEAPPCQQVLRGWSVDEKQALLDAAGQERLRRKAVRLAQRVEEIGVAQLIYEETLAVLGYKHNKQTFRSLAERVPLVELREASRGNVMAGHAILMGVAGLLPARLSARWDEETREYVRRLWDVWFKQRERWSDRVMERSQWRTSGLRPANQPVRRIAAIAPLFVGARSALPQLLDSPPRSALRVVQQAERALEEASAMYWDQRLAWGARKLASRVALIGEERIKLVTTNVILPLLAADGRTEPIPDQVLAAFPPEGDNQVIRQAAFNLFGAHHPASWYRTGLRRQGLIQVFHDFCLNDRSRCAQCSFPELLRQFKNKTAP